MSGVIERVVAEYVQRMTEDLLKLPPELQKTVLKAAIESMPETDVLELLPAMMVRVSNWSVVPHDVFEALMKARVAVALEMVLLACNPYGGDPWVYLTRRPPNDPHYANLLHVPGSIQRPNEDVIDVAQRLQRSEFGFDLPRKLQFVDLNMNHDTRGSCLGLIYLGRVPQLPEDRTNWYRVSDLDRSQLCIHHGKPFGIIDKAVKSWFTDYYGEYRSLEIKP